MAPSAITNEPTTTPHDPSRPRILVPEKVSSEGLALLRSLYEVDLRPSLSPDEDSGAGGVIKYIRSSYFYGKWKC